ncbi:MAG: methionyl-tRNA formyltransferase [Chthoniobacterales bacterium]
MRVFFFGTGDIGLPVFRALAESNEHLLAGLITQPDRPAGRQMALRAPVIKEEAIRYHIPVFQPEKVKSESVVAQIRNFQPDVGIVIAYGQILPKAVLDLPRYGCLNVHVSLLPKYRGASPIQTAIAEGERTTGITVMYMDEGLDTGEILLQAPVTIERDDTAGSLHDKLADEAVAPLLKALDDLTKNRAARIPQDEALASYASKLTREKARIDWSQPAEVIEHRIRAYQPWPVAFTNMPVGKSDWRAVKIYSASVINLPGESEAGTVMECVPEGIIIATGRGGLLLRSVHPEGGRIMAADEFARGGALRAGECCN